MEDLENKVLNLIVSCSNGGLWDNNDNIAFADEVNIINLKDKIIDLLKYHTQWHLDRVAEVVCEEADTTQKECFYTGVRAGGSYFISIVDKQSITNAIKEYINENLK